jgi:IS30 family transposase
VLSLKQREEISRALVRGLSARTIARRLGMAPSTVSREIARNGGREKYRAAHADERAWANAKRPKRPLLTIRRALRTIVAAKLRDDWSPEQIAGWLAAKYPHTPSMRISHETIYRSLYLQARRVLHRELLHRLRTGRLMRKGKKASTDGQRRGQIIDAVSIHERPQEIGGPSQTGALRRRPHNRAAQLSHRDPCRAVLPLRHSGEGKGQE